WNCVRRTTATGRGPAGRPWRSGASSSGWPGAPVECHTPGSAARRTDVNVAGRVVSHARNYSGVVNGLKQNRPADAARWGRVPCRNSRAQLHEKYGFTHAAVVPSVPEFALVPDVPAPQRPHPTRNGHLGPGGSAIHGVQFGGKTTTASLEGE